MSEIIDGKYELLEEIGRGGMGSVFKAYHRDLDRFVAVKMLSEELASEPDFLARFKQEAAIVGSLIHPNIVAVYDIVRHGRTYCIIMEYVEGKSLQWYIDHEVLPERDVLNIGAQVARALHYAHERGIVHRDVKPDNILLTATKIAKITDFGIARGRQSALKTQTGVSMGTPRFMSPEQVTGRDLDGRSDLYSLGICLYYALTGQPPFDGENAIAVATRHIYDTPIPPSQLNPAISPAAEKVILRALEKSKDARFANGEEMARALEEAAGSRVPVVVASDASTTIPLGATTKMNFATPPRASSPVAANGAPTPLAGSSTLATPTFPTPIPTLDELVENDAVTPLPPPTKSNLREALSRTLRANWGFVAAFVIVVGVAVAALWQYRMNETSAAPLRRLPAPGPSPAAPVQQLYEQLLAEAQQALAQGRAREALDRVAAFKAKYPDFEPQRLELLVDRLTAALPPTETDLLAQRREQKGKRFLNDQKRLALARAYLRAARELQAGQQRDYVLGEGYLRLLDKGASATLAAQRDPGAAALAFARAQNYLRSPEADERSQAEKELMDAVELDPENYDYWFALANFYSLLGMRDDARVVLRYIEDVAPRTSEAYRRATQELRRLDQ